MTVAEMEKILKTEYGINSREELTRAMALAKGVDISVFTEKRGEKNGNEN